MRFVVRSFVRFVADLPATFRVAFAPTRCAVSTFAVVARADVALTFCAAAAFVADDAFFTAVFFAAAWDATAVADALPAGQRARITLTESATIDSSVRRSMASSDLRYRQDLLCLCGPSRASSAWRWSKPSIRYTVMSLARGAKPVSGQSPVVPLA